MICVKYVVVLRWQQDTNEEETWQDIEENLAGWGDEIQI